MKQKTQYIFIFSIFLTLVACTKTTPTSSRRDAELPAITSEGKYTFGCKINENVWMPEVDFSFYRPQVFYNTYDPDSGRLYIVASRYFDKEGINDKVIFTCKGVFEEGEYELYITNNNQTGFRTYDSRFNCGAYFHDTDNPGTLKIHHFEELDSSRIISGTFSMDLISNLNCESEALKVTEGRFDLKFY